MISIDNLGKAYGKHILFEGASFKLNQKEKAGLVGRNGHGKTTLLRIITGEDTPDEGSVTIPRNYRIGYVKQQLNFTEDTVLKEGMKGLIESEKEDSWKVEKVLAGLGFQQSDMSRNPLEFSGGYQIRLNLAKVLVSEPDLLLLDEPTNYLDITSIRWIEKFLQSWSRELMLITHDRGFMDKVITHTIGIHRKKLRKIPGTTEKYYTQIAQDEEIYEKTRLNDERKRKEVELFITRFRAKARLAGLVQSRVKALEKQDKKTKLENLKTLEFSFREKEYNGKYVLSAKNISFGFNQTNPLINGLDITIGAHDKICVVGQNGKGKTTLLRLIAGDLQQATGDFIWNKGVEWSFFEQTNIGTLADKRTIEEEIMASAPDIDRQTARNICAAMLFEGDDALKKIAVLSGGEKSRVMLGKILATPVNMLLLDEPTNHLDMESCDALLAAIDSFDGAVILVTHNEMFLHALAERLIVFQDGKSSVFEGSYQDFLDKGGWGDEETPLKPDQPLNSTDTAFGRKELRKARSQIITERSKMLRPLEQKIENIENEIGALENESKILNESIDQATQGRDGKKIAELSVIFAKNETRINFLFDELDKLSTEYDSLKAVFDERLENITDDNP
jgi:ATP-binding cassette, subfamily F, member 3